MTVLMTPDKANFAGNVHGGALLELLDQVAYTCASRYAGSYVMTLSVDRVLFRQAINVGELVTFSASVNYVGRTSMEVGIRVEAEHIQNGTKRHVNSSYFTMVAVDDSGRPIGLPKLAPSTDVEKRRFEDAQRRRQAQRAAFACANHAASNSANSESSSMPSPPPSYSAFNEKPWSAPAPTGWALRQQSNLAAARDETAIQIEPHSGDRGVPPDSTLTFTGDPERLLITNAAVVVDPHRIATGRMLSSERGSR
jgi:acyl-CoA hydrolase